MYTGLICCLGADWLKRASCGRGKTRHRCVRRTYPFQFSSASSPTRSLRSVAGAAASGICSLMVGQHRCRMVKGGRRAATTHPLNLISGQCAATERCRTEPDRSCRVVRQWVNPHLHGVCVVAAPSHPPCQLQTGNCDQGLLNQSNRATYGFVATHQVPAVDETLSRQ